MPVKQMSETNHFDIFSVEHMAGGAGHSEAIVFIVEDNEFDGALRPKEVFANVGCEVGRKIAQSHSTIPAVSTTA